MPEQITKTEYMQEMRKYCRCVILDTKCIDDNCDYCNIGIAFRRGIEWGKRHQK